LITPCEKAKEEEKPTNEVNNSAWIFIKN